MLFTAHGPALTLFPRPEFLEVRKDHTFFECCQTPAIACELTLQPIRRFKGLLDAAIIFCDILVVPVAMGMPVEMNPAPSLPNPLRTPADMDTLLRPAPIDVDKELGYVFEAVRMTRIALDGEVPLIGFCGAPWTLMAYMIEGGGSKTFQRAKEWLYRWPEESKKLLMRIADVCVDLLVGQVLAGAQVRRDRRSSRSRDRALTPAHFRQLLQVFDSWANELSPSIYQEFALPASIAIQKAVRAKLSTLGVPDVPMTLFAKGANTSLDIIAQSSGYDCLGLDWCIDPAAARHLVGKNVALQGNADPMVLYGGRDAIEREVARMSEAFGRGEGGWIANLGHGVTPQVKPEDFEWFLRCVHKYSAKTGAVFGAGASSEKL